MIKQIYLIFTLSYVFISSMPLFQNVATAQEYPGCFMIDSSGERSSLNSLCNRNQQQQKLRNVMNARELYQQGRDRGRRGLYKEAVEDFTQAININPDFAEAYIARAYARTLTRDNQGLIEDFQKAIDIYIARGDSEKANMVLKTLQDFKRQIQMEEQKEIKLEEQEAQEEQE
jgi:tetratricopeptide (TPR) repeat protein